MITEGLKSFLRSGVLISLVVVVVFAVFYLVTKAVMGIKPNPELVAWFNTPISQLRATHIILFIWFAGFIFRK
ncbi:MAG: hypothetical protein A2Z52_00565 [Candidatus Moranbacteria bacterium RBG_19FT_COMBO_42_6]|nr:MAG: hypothetical protein A2Z52_00565 [Candidatus Moranbacteria bacterium RBG_19FT_COMBO_42_6]